MRASRRASFQRFNGRIELPNASVVGRPDARVDLVDRPAGVDEDDAVLRHVLREVAVEDGERALHLVLLVELRRLAARWSPLGGRRRRSTSSTMVRSGARGVAVERADPLDRVARRRAPLETLWYARLDAS